MKRGDIRLRSLGIRGYKSIPFRHPLKLNLGDINILLGANGAGKSNIVSFFKLLGYMMNGNLQRFVAETGSIQKFLNYGPKTTPSLNASLELVSPDYSLLYKFKLKHTVADNLIVDSEEIDWKEISDSEYSHKQLQSDFRESALVSSTGKIETSARNLLGSCKVYQFSDSSFSSPMRRSSEVESAHFLQSDGGNLASFLYYLKRSFPAEYKRITEYVRDVVPQFREFYLEPEGKYISLKWRDNSLNDYVLSADQFSDGSIRFIALATLLLQPQDTMPFVMIVDEPELGLHPYAIDQFNEMVKDAARHAQIIVATQSTSIIDGFPIDDITVIERDKEIDGTVAKKLSEAEYMDWLEEYSLSELWNKNVIGGRPS